MSLEGLIAASEQPANRLCRACFDGVYPIELPEENLVGKHVLEGVGRRVDMSRLVAETAGGSGTTHAVNGAGGSQVVNGVNGSGAGPGLETAAGAKR